MSRKLLKGAFIITFGLMASKFLSLFFIFPFSNMVGPIGLSLYSYAYIPYTIFLDVSTMGIPLGIAKSVSEYDALGKHKTIKKLLKTSLIFMLIVSVIGFILLNLISGVYARIVLGGSNVNSLSSVKRVINIISLAILIIPFTSIFRGYFQGKKKMSILAISQIIEQVIRVSFILITCYLLYKQGYEKAVNMAVFAAFISGIGSLIILLIYYFKEKKEKSDEEVNSKQVFKKMIKYAIPFALVGLNLAMYNLADSLFFNSSLNASNSEIIYGVYSFEIQRLINIPVTLAIGLAVNLMPHITSLLVNGNVNKVKEYISTSYHMIFLIVLPITLLTMLYANQLYSLFYHNLEYGGHILFSCAPLILIYSLNSVTNSIMQGINKGRILLVSLLVGIIIKFSFNYLFIKYFGYSGAVLATSLAMLTAMALNLYHMRKYIDYKPMLLDFTKLLFKTLIPLLIVYVIFKNLNLPNILFLSLLVTIYFVIYCAIIKGEIHNLIIGDANGKEGTI